MEESWPSTARLCALWRPGVSSSAEPQLPAERPLELDVELLTTATLMATVRIPSKSVALIIAKPEVPPAAASVAQVSLRSNRFAGAPGGEPCRQDPGEVREDRRGRGDRRLRVR